MNLRDRYVVGSKDTELYLVRHPSNMNINSMPTLQYSLQARKEERVDVEGEHESSVPLNVCSLQPSK